MLKQIGLCGSAAFLVAALSACGRQPPAPRSGDAASGLKAHAVADGAAPAPVAKKPPPGLEATIRGFARAARKRNMKALAALVVGGATDFDYRKFKSGLSYYRDSDYTTIKIFGVRAAVQGDSATAEFMLVLKDAAGVGIGLDPESVTDKHVLRVFADAGSRPSPDTVKLKRVNGAWKIVPPFLGEEGQLTDFARWAYEVTYPGKVVTEVESSPTLNRSEQNAKLGLGRAKLFDEARRNDLFSSDEYSGSSTMFGAQHTTMLWPLGRSNEVFFYQSNGMDKADGAYLTHWRRVAGRAHRMWQVRLKTTRSDTGGPNEGTLAKWLRNKGGRLAKRAPGTVVERLRRVEAYAAYAEVPVVENLNSWIVRGDASETWPAEPSQDFEEALRRGFFISPEESKALQAKRRRG